MKRSPIRKQSKNPAESLRRKCVTLAKQIVRRLGKYTCEYCGKSEPQVMTHGSHIYSEGTYRSMSADLDNIIVLCFSHHLGIWNKKDPSWHNNPMEMTDWFREKYPDRYLELRDRSRQIFQADRFFWEEKLKDLKEIEAKIK